MATNAQKQAFLEGLGKKKSLSYFATGPNLGENWDWDKALQGGYSQAELDDFMGKAEGAYQSHKNKDKNTEPLSADNDAAGTSPLHGSCAKTGAKAISTAVGVVKGTAEKLYTMVFYHGDSIKPFELDMLQTMSKKLDGAMKEMVADGIEHGVEYQAAASGRELVRMFEALDETRQAYSETLALMETAGSPDEILAALKGLRTARTKMGNSFSKTTNIDEWGAIVASDIDADAFAQLHKVRNTLYDAADELYQDATRAVMQRGAANMGMDDLAAALADGPEVLFNQATAVANASLSSTQIMATIDEAQNMAALARAAIIHEVGDPGDWIPIFNQSQVWDGLEQIWAQSADQTYGLLQSLETLDDWLGGPTLQAGAMLEQVAVAGGWDEFAAWYLQQVNRQATLKGIGVNVGSTLAGDLLVPVKAAFDEAMDQAKHLLPGYTPTNNAAAQILGEGYIEAIEAATDAELKPLVIAQLEADGQTPSLAYFLTKKQKISYLKDPDAFPNTEWSLNYKGQPLSGKGFTTAEYKYAEKNGNITTGTPLTAETPSVGAAGKDLVTGFDAPIPAGSPKWYGDPATSKQFHYFKKLADEAGVSTEPHMQDVLNAWGKGQITKGQASHLIDGFTDQVMDAANTSSALKYSVDLIEEVEDSVQAVKAVTNAEEVLPPGYDPGLTAAQAKAKLTGGDHYGGVLQMLDEHSPETYDAYVAWFEVAVEQGDSKAFQHMAAAFDEAGQVTAGTIEGLASQMESVINKGIAGGVDIDDMGSVLKSEFGSEVSGSAQKLATSAAPDHVGDWDAPHTFSYMGDGQSKWGGAHRKWWFQDEDGQDWMLKNGTGFRVEGELSAHRLAHSAGFDVAEARITTQKVSGRNIEGFMQKMFAPGSVRGELKDFQVHGGFERVEGAITRQLQEHQVVDWLMGNHDGHNQNFLMLADGRLVGIDKGQAFKFYGRDRLAHDYKPAGNVGEVAYNRMWQDYRAGRVDLDLDSIDEALAKVEAISDDEIRRIVRPYAEGRFSAPSREAFLSGTTATSADELVEMVVARKNRIRDDFTAFYQEQARARGETWTPRWTKNNAKAVQASKPKAVKAGDVLTPIDDELVEGLHRAGTAGKSVYVAGAEIQEGQILFDIVKDTSGREVLRVNFHARPDADRRIVKLLSEEGAEPIAAGGGYTPAPSMPAQVQKAGQYGSNTLSGAKTINHHISEGDFEFNTQTLGQVQTQLDEVNEILANEDVANWAAAGKMDSIDSGMIEDLIEAGLSPTEIADEIENAAALLTQAQAGEVFKPLMDEIVAQGKMGNAAAKVPHVPSFDAPAFYNKLKDGALKRAEDLQDAAAQTGQLVSTEPAPQVFARLQRTRAQTSAIEGGDYRVGTYRGLRDIYGRQMYHGTTNDGWELLYRDIANSADTHKGWAEIVIPTDGQVTAETVREALDFITEKMGVQTRLAKAEDMELIYWRQVLGTYRNSKQGTGTSAVRRGFQGADNPWSKAMVNADDNLKALGPNPSSRAEIDAIKGGFRQAFGDVIDEADYLPIHNHALDESLEEVGIGFFERPELTGEMTERFRGKVFGHDVAYLHRTNLDENYVNSATGDGLFSQQERQRYGFKVSAASGDEDINTGGSYGLYSRVMSAGRAKGNMVYFNPNRVTRKLGNYNSPTDSFGNLSRRGSNNNLDPAEVARYTGQNEVMMKHVTSWIDDAEVAVFDSNQRAEAFRQHVRRRLNSDTIRGVPIEDRFISMTEIQKRGYGVADSYVKDFFEAHVVRRGGYRERLRRDIESLRSGLATAARGAERAAERVKLKSRAAIKNLNESGFGRFTKSKLSTGRGYRTQVGPQFGPQSRKVDFKIHTTENALSLRADDLEGIPQLTEQSWTSVHKAAVATDFGTGDVGAILVDVSTLGMDLRALPNAQRKRAAAGLVRALLENKLDDWTARWSPFMG